jgi:hypothetical protein
MLFLKMHKPDGMAGVYSLFKKILPKIGWFMSNRTKFKHKKKKKKPDELGLEV